MAQNSNELIKSTKTLDNEVKAFADGLQYWAKYLAEKILFGSAITDIIIDDAYSFLLQELKLIPNANKPPITINYNLGSNGSFKKVLQFTKLEEVNGVNALKENQTIEFGPNLTIIYGSNGSGKSGYVRMLKKVFYSKAPEEIIKNIYLDSGHKSVSATFNFKSDGKDISHKYPDKSTSPEFDQFSVFDGKSILKHLDQRNEFEFRPSGLKFFAEFTEAIKRVELKLNTEIGNKYSSNYFPSLFEGDSKIKKIIENLSESINIPNLQKYFPLSENELAEKKRIEKKYDDLLLSSKGKEKEITTLESLKKLTLSNKEAIETLNGFFNSDRLKIIYSAISDCLIKESIARREGIESLRSITIKEIGSDEWKAFIEAAEKFALQQKDKETVYPDSVDFCIFCHQPLSNAAQYRILNYWSFLKSNAEQNAKGAQDRLSKIKAEYEKLNFDLFPKDNSLTIWLSERYTNLIPTITQNLTGQKQLSESIIADISTKTPNNRAEIKISTVGHDIIIKDIEESSKLTNDSKLFTELNRLLTEKNLLAHREKLELHFTKIENYIKNQQWISNANKFGWQALKLIITTTEKRLSSIYFNKEYIDIFNEECKELHGEFGISIDSKSAEAKSNRQLLIKGNFPSSILSEGEQKVIAIADFLAEMKLSEINRGLIFDDPVNSLDENRKSEIAERLVKESQKKQVIVFTHDLVFVSSLVSSCDSSNTPIDCHWIERTDDKPGTVWLRNTPSFEKAYKKSGKALEYYNEAKVLGPEKREDKIKNGFAALRTSYESLVIFDLFNGVVQRFNERVSIDSLSEVFIDTTIKDELIDSFSQCCRYMEGHLHGDKYAYKKPILENLNEEINRFNVIKKKILELKKKNKASAQ